MVRTTAGLAVFVLLSAPLLAQEPAVANPPSPPVSAPAPAAAPDVQAMPSVLSLFTGLGRDIRHLPSRETAIVLGVAGGLSLAVHSHDADVTKSASGSEMTDEVLDAGATVGGGEVQIGLAVAAYALGRIGGNTPLATVGADLVRAQILDMLLTQGLKFAVDRTRPDGHPYSFPSGHTSSTFATAAVLARHFGWKAAVPAYGVATYVAASRLSENKHYLSDVIFGAGLGIVSGRAVTVGRGKAKFGVAPFAAAGGGGVGFTWLGAQ